MYATIKHTVDFTKENWSRLMDKNFDRLRAEDTEAKRKGELLGRVVRHHYADGHAYYQVVKVNAKSVKIQVCRGLGDDWVLPAWGEKATIPVRDVDHFQAFRAW